MIPKTLTSVRRFSNVIKDPNYYIDLEDRYGCHNYKPLPVVVSKAKGIYVWDVTGKRYIDCVAGISAVNQGHCHPKIAKAMIAQMKKVTVTSRAIYTNKLGPLEKQITELFKYDKVHFSNGGVESGEAAIKFSRRWAYRVKGVPENKAKVLFCNNNFWGRTIAACGSSNNPDRFAGFGPFEGLGFELIDYNDPVALEEKIKNDPNISAFMVESIQGEGGVILPNDGYLKKVRNICTKYNVLFICDEVQAALGRCGKMLGCEWEHVRPDIICLGKSLSGGYYPISAILCDDPIMNLINPGEHGSTFGGNPLACAVASESLKVLIEEKMVENSLEMGTYMLEELSKACKGFDFVKEVRGRGLFIAMEFNKDGLTGKHVATKGLDHGIILKDTQTNMLRVLPPLVIKKREVDKTVELIHKTLKSL